MMGFSLHWAKGHAVIQYQTVCEKRNWFRCQLYEMGSYSSRLQFPVVDRLYLPGQVWEHFWGLQQCRLALKTKDLYCFCTVFCSWYTMHTQKPHQTQILKTGAKKPNNPQANKPKHHQKNHPTNQPNQKHTPEKPIANQTKNPKQTKPTPEKTPSKQKNHTKITRKKKTCFLRWN